MIKFLIILGFVTSPIWLSILLASLSEVVETVSEDLHGRV